MKMKTRYAPLLAFCPLLLPVVLPAQPSATRAAAPPVSVDDRQEFRNGFQQAMSIKSKAEMSRLVKKYQDQATIWIIDTAEAISNAPNDRLFERMDALRNAWTDAIKTDFVNHMEKYYSLLDGTQKRERVRFKNDFDKKLASFQEHVRNKETRKLSILANNFESLAGSFDSVGDNFYASQCWSLVGACSDEEHQGNRADLHKSCEAFGKMLEFRDRIELKDGLYLTTRARYDRLVGLGFGPSVPDAEGAAPGAAASAGAVIEASMTYELMGDLVKPTRPNYFLDEHYPMWSTLGLQAKGSSFDIPRLENVRVMRVGAAEVQIDTNGDGEGDVEVPLRGKMEPVELEIGDGDDKRTWSFLTMVGIQKDVYQGMEVNLEANDEYLTIYYAPCASMVGDVGGTRIQVIDDSLDGLYGNPPMRWGHIGLSAGHFQPEMDSVVIAGGKRALPWSEFQKIGDQWYKLEVQHSGTTILAQPVELSTGKLKLDFNGPKPAFLVVQGEGKYENSFFDLCSTGTVEVPRGRYGLYFGMVSKGKKRQTIKALILSGENTPKWTVDEGKTVEVTLGKPFGFDFKFVADEDTIVVDGSSVVVTGVADERYERPWGCVPRPEVSYRKAGSKRGSKGEKMATLRSQQELYDTQFKQGWSPKDLTLKKKPSETEVEVHLFEKKNKLFGKVDSVWRK